MMASADKSLWAPPPVTALGAALIAITASTGLAGCYELAVHCEACFVDDRSRCETRLDRSLREDHATLHAMAGLCRDEFGSHVPVQHAGACRIYADVMVNTQPEGYPEPPPDHFVVTCERRWTRENPLANCGRFVP